MSNQRRLGAVLSYVNIVLKNITNFLYVPILLRLVGQSDYGLFQMTNSVTSSLTILSMGLSSAYVKFYIDYKTKEKKEEIKKLNGLYLALFILISFLAVIIGVILTFNTSRLFGNTLNEREIKLAQELMLILVLNIAITFPSSVFDSNILVNQHFVFQQSRQIFQTILVPVLSIALIYAGFGILSVGLTQLIITFVYLIINIRYCCKRLAMKFSFHGFTKVLIKQLLAFSLFILLNQIVDLINNNAPNFIIGMVRGARDVATFAIALQIKNMFFMLSTSLSSVFVPQVNEYVSSNKPPEVLTDLMIRIGRIQMTILFFILGGFIVVGRFFISIWAGSENMDAYHLIIMMVLPSIVPLSQNVGIEIQRAQNKHMFRSVIYTVFAFVNIIITYFGSKYIGLEGASLGYIFSMIFANGFLMNWYYHSRILLNMRKFWRSTIPTITPFLMATGILLGIQFHIPVDTYFQFFLQGVIYVILYSIFYIKLVASKYEKTQLKNLINIKR